MRTLLDSMNDFIESGDRNAWCYEDRFEIYFRNSTRYYNRKYVNVLDIANISVYEDHQRQGLFKEFLSLIRENVPLDGFIIENVLNSDFERYLRTFTWDRIDQQDEVWPPTFWKMRKV